MSIAITDEHRVLADTAEELLRKRDARAETRRLLDGPPEPRPTWWSEIAGLGWLGLHLPEDVGGSGFGFEELVVIVEALGRAVAPGPFVPTVIASALVDRAGDAELRTRILPGLADGSMTAGVSVT